MATRRCLVCKRMGSQNELIRLHSYGTELRTHKSKPSKGRSVWLCHRTHCLDQLTAQPGRASPGLRQRIKSGPDCHLISNQLRWASVQSGLKFCMQSGLVDRLYNQNLTTIHEKWIAILWSESSIHAPKIHQALIEHPIAVFHLPVSEEALGAAIGRPPCAGLLIQPGKPSRRLLTHLHRFVRTG